MKVTESFTIHRDKEIYPFLNMCNLCRYARFSQAQSQFMTRVRIRFACVACERVLLMLVNACNMRVERVSDAF